MRMIFSTGGVLLALVLAACACLSDPAQAGSGFLSPQAGRASILLETHARGAIAVADSTALLMRARAEGRIRIIVGVILLMRDEDTLSVAEAQTQRWQLLGIQNAVIARTFAAGPEKGVVRYEFIPFIAMYVDEPELQRLLIDPQVASIEEDVLFRPSLADSVPLTHTDDVWTKSTGTGNDVGTGYVVAVLDTGVAHLNIGSHQAHPMLAGKVVSEACYSTADPATGVGSFCPGGVNASTATGSGVNCNIAGCDHGTHVASIALGKPAGKLSGIAKASRLIAIQIFSRFGSGADCTPDPPPCIGAPGSDMARGIERVYSLRNTFRIAALNLSVGDFAHSAGNCAAVDERAVGRALQLVRSVRIAPIVAAGNDNAFGNVSFPACTTYAIAIGNSTKGKDGDKLEHVFRGAGGSNHAEWVKLMAPGTDIKAAIPAGFPGAPYDEKTGTSMAAPHVSGAFALLRQAKPGASVQEILDALTCSGKTVEWPEGQQPLANRVAKPRIDLLGAFNWLKRVPNATRTWNFEDEDEAHDWTPFLGRWEVEAGNYAPAPIPNGAVLSSTANCNTRLEVIAKIRRVYAIGGKDDPNVAPNAGIMVKSKLDYQGRTISGYFFGYNYFPRGEDPKERGWGFIQRVEESSQARVICWKTTDVPVKFRDWNTIRAVSDGATQKLFINGKLICQGTDATFKSGPVGALTGFSTSYTTTRGTFAVESVITKSIGDGGAATEEPTPFAATAAIGSTPPVSGEPSPWIAFAGVDR